MDALPPHIETLVGRGALFVINDSGGKDSQAMKIILRRLIPRGQLVIVHAHLPLVEWEGSLEHVERYSEGIPVLVAEASKTFIDMVDHRGMFPSPKYRQCTSDLKRNPIERELRAYLKLRPIYGGLVVNCMGLRAEESTARSKRSTFALSRRNSKAGREWYDWLPIHDMTTDEVFATIAAAGEEPFHVYKKGMTRKSCCFCIMASQQDLTTAAGLVPETYALICAKERQHGFTLSMSGKYLPEITGVEPERT